MPPSNTALAGIVAAFAAGRATFRVEASVVDLEFFLVGAGLLRPGDADRSVVETALAKLIEQLTTSNA